MLVTVSFAFHSCRKDTTATPSEVTGKQLSSGVWKVQSVMVDGTDKTNLFHGFTLQYSSTTFSSSNGTLVWPSSGTWNFKDETAKMIVRDDGLEMTIETVSNTKFTFSFVWTKTTYGGGRSNSTSGVYSFEMIH